jgi:hypothetical protein
LPLEKKEKISMCQKINHFIHLNLNKFRTPERQNLGLLSTNLFHGLSL